MWVINTLTIGFAFSIWFPISVL